MVAADCLVEHQIIYGIILALKLMECIKEIGGMRLKKIIDNGSIESDHVIFTSEGFLDIDHLPRLQNHTMRVIKLRVLSDGPVFHVVPSNQLHS